MGDGELVDDEHAAAAQRVEEHHTHHGLPADGRTRVNTDGGKRIRSILGDAGLVWCVWAELILGRLHNAWANSTSAHSGTRERPNLEGCFLFGAAALLSLRP